MTIAAGFRFAEGVLICADTEISAGTAKYQASKIFAYDFVSNGSNSKAVFAFSGSVHYAQMAIQRCQRALSARPQDKMTRGGMADTIADSLHSFHMKYVLKHPEYRLPGGPDFWLVIGLWSPDDGLGLYDTEGAAIREIGFREFYSCTGVGRDLGRYLLRHVMPHPHLKLADVTVAALHMLRDVKTAISGCGGTSEMLVIKEDGFISEPGAVDISHAYGEMEHFDATYKHLLLAACDLDTKDENVRERLDGLWMAIEAMRTTARDEAKPPRSMVLLNTLRMAGRVEEV